MPDASILKAIAHCALFVIAVINPVSKIAVLSVLAERNAVRELRRVSLRASVIAAIMLLPFALFGSALLTKVFHVDIHSFQICGGLVLLYRGLLAVNKGFFFESDPRQSLDDMSVVPLASPLIAGPAAITASVTLPVTFGTPVTLVAIVAALAVNYGVMFFSATLSAYLDRHHLLGALIRITGLIVSSIGIQMVLDGLTAYLASV